LFHSHLLLLKENGNKIEQLHEQRGNNTNQKDLLDKRVTKNKMLAILKTAGIKKRNEPYQE